MNNDNYSGQIIGNYLVMEKLGSGEFGSVYRAQNKMIAERIVAIKLINAKYVSSREECEHFLNEARVLLRLQHAYILPVFDVGEHQGVPYIVLEFSPTGSLRSYLEKLPKRQLPLKQALILLDQVGQGLQFAHMQHIVHRDLKPENILFNPRGEALLADFGIATEGATSTNRNATVIGTPPYMAPEQFEGTVSKLSDQYALGCIAYELVTGRRPFQAMDFVGWAIKHADETPLPPRQLNPALPIHVEHAILKAMAKERTNRFPDVAAFTAALSSSASLPPTVGRTVLKSAVGQTVLDTTDVTIGRRPDNSCVLNDAQVSGYHAVIRHQGQNYTLVDLNSRNKTYVNGQAIPPQVAHMLKQGDSIRIGATVFTYVDELSAPVIPATVLSPPADVPPTVAVPPVAASSSIPATVAAATPPPPPKGNGSYVQPSPGVRARGMEAGGFPVAPLMTPVFAQKKSYTGLWIFLTVIGMLVVFVVIGSVFSHLGGGNTPVVTPIPTDTPVPDTPAPQATVPQATLPVLNARYAGSITDSNQISNVMTLIQVQEVQSGSIRGGTEITCPFDFCSINGAPTIFGGSVDTNRNINFSFSALINGTNVIITFTGTVSADNATLSGTYTGSDGESGRWSVTSS